MKRIVVVLFLLLLPSLANSGQGMGPGPGITSSGKTKVIFSTIGIQESYSLPSDAYVDEAYTTPGATITCAGAGGGGNGGTGGYGDRVVGNPAGIVGQTLLITIGEGGYANGSTATGFVTGPQGAGGASGLNVGASGKIACTGGAAGNGTSALSISYGGTITTGAGSSGGANGQNGQNGYITLEYYRRQLYSDAFTGTNGTALATHDANWVSVDAGHLVSGLALYGDTARSAAGAWGGAVYNTSSSNVSQISVQPVSASVLKGPCVRAGGANGTGYCIDLGSKVGSNYTRLNLRKNGVLLTYATVAAPVSSAYTLRVEASGTAPAIIDCYMDGSLVISRTDSSSPLIGGHPGFIVESNGVIEDTAVDSWYDYPN